MMSEVQERICDLCDTETEVNWECQECEETLCNTCKNIHLKSKATRNHHAILLDEKITDYNEGPKEQGADEELCRKHSTEKLQRYCKNCDEALCIECLFSHHGHTLIKLSEVLVQKQQELSAILKQTKNTSLFNLDNTLEEMKEKKEKYANETQNSIEEIKRRGHTVKTEFDKIQDKFIEELKNQEQKQIEDFDKCINELEHQKSNMKMILTKAENQLASTSEISTLSKVIKNLRRKLGDQREITQPSVTYVRFKESISNKVDFQKMYGHMYTQKVTGNGETVTEDGEMVIDDGEMVTDDGEMVTDDGEMVTNGGRTVTDDERFTDGEKVTDDGKKVTNDDERVTNDEETISADEENDNNDDELASDVAQGVIISPVQDFKYVHYQEFDEVYTGNHNQYQHQLSSNSTEITQISSYRNGAWIISCFRDKEIMSNIKKELHRCRILSSTYPSYHNIYLTKVQLTSVNGKSVLPLQLERKVVLGMTILNSQLFISDGELKQILYLPNQNLDVTEEYRRVTPYSFKVFVKTEEYKPNNLCSTNKGHLLVCLIKPDSRKIVQYTMKAQIAQEIEFTDKGQPLFKNPTSIVVNQQDDIWIEDSGTVMVLDQKGRLKFVYKGLSGPNKADLLKNHQLKSKFRPGGMTSNQNGKVFICDNGNSLIHIVDKTGVTVDLIKSDKPRCITNDSRKNCLWVTSDDCRVSIIKYSIN